jgi:amino acid transporter
LALAISFFIVLATYMTLVLALVGSINWQELAGMNAPITRLAEQLFGNTGGLLITIAAIGAAATSINALILITSRDIVALANDGVFSKHLAVPDEATSKPTLSILAVTILAVGALLISETIMEYAIWVGAIVMLYQVIIGLAILSIWSKAQQAYQATSFHLGRWGLITCGVGLILVSLAFLALVFWDSNARVVGAFVYLGIGVIYYLIRSRSNKTKGIQLN